MNDIKFYKMDAGAKVHDGVLLSRIVATEGCPHAAPGTLGGWIESEDNLSGNAWVADNAMVYGNARVFGNAKVCDYAIVRDNAEVSGNALICGKAMICDAAKVSGNSCVSDCAKVGGNACMRKNACAYDCAVIIGHASITGCATVRGAAVVNGYAIVKDVSFVAGNARIMDHVRIDGNTHIGGKYILMGSAVIDGDKDYDAFTYGGTGTAKPLMFTASNQQWCTTGFYGTSSQLLDYARKQGRSFYDYCYCIICAVMAERRDWHLIEVNDDASPKPIDKPEGSEDGQD